MRLFVFIAVLATLGGAVAGASPLLPATPRDAVEARVLFLPEDSEALDEPPAEGEERLTVTGAYSSGDRFAPEGFVIRRGDATHPYPQGWDGLLLIDGDGRLSLHDVSAVAYRGRVFNLRDKPTRTTFVERAEADALTAIQSHLLINEGALDLKPVAGARTFRRRLLFETRSGEIGIWDSSPRVLTLYDAAAELQEAVAPRFALNLDMGAYDFCERQRGSAEPERCGVVSRQTLSKLTNLLSLTTRAE